MANHVVNIRVLAEETMKGLSELEKQQFPFALAKTLTDLALGSAEAVRARTRAIFELKTEFIPKGIGIKPATKGDVKAGREHDNTRELGNVRRRARGRRRKRALRRDV